MDYIIDYINDTFRLNMNGIISLTVFDKNSNREVSYNVLCKQIQTVFDLTDDEYRKVFEHWVKSQRESIFKELRGGTQMCP